MDTKRKVECLRFEHWSVAYADKPVFPYGLISLRPKRAEVLRADDLTPDERHELFDVAIRQVEALADELFRPAFVWEEWTGRSFVFLPLKLVRHPYPNRRVLTAHAA